MLDRAYADARLVREGDPEWRDDVPVRVETIPVPRGGRVIAVIARNTNLLGVRTPSRLELSYLQSAADLTAMIAAGDFPPDGTAQRPRRLTARGGRVRAGRRAGPGHLRQPERALGLPPAGVVRRPRRAGPRGGDAGAGAAAAPARRGDAERRARRPRPPRHRDRRRPGVADRAVDPAASPAGEHVGGAGARARRDRPAPPRPRAGHQGRHDPGDPPPGEEQPADRGRAAAAPGAPDRVRRGPVGAGGGGTPGRARSRSCTRPSARRCSTRSPSTRSPTGSGRWSPTSAPGRTVRATGPSYAGRGPSGCSPTRRRPRWRWCSPSCCRTPSSTAIPSRRGRARSSSSPSGWPAGCG